MNFRFRIMIIDDEPIVGKRLKRLLEKNGYEVEIFTRGSTAVEEIEKNASTLLLLTSRWERSAA